MQNMGRTDSSRAVPTVLNEKAIRQFSDSAIRQKRSKQTNKQAPQRLSTSAKKMFKLFQKHKTTTTTLGSHLQLDFHSHLIPGIDDGSPDITTSIQLIKAFIDLGYKKLITTPHIYKDYYPNTTAIIKEGLKTLQKAVKEEALDIEIEAAAEYFIDANFEKLLMEKDLLPIFDNQVLIEFSFFGPPPNLAELLFEMQIKGYQPILAHPERYSFLQGDIRQYQELKSMGCLFQANLLAFTDHYGKPVKETAHNLLKHKLYDYAGTDLHHIKHVALLNKLNEDYKMVNKLVEYGFKNCNIA